MVLGALQKLLHDEDKLHALAADSGAGGLFQLAWTRSHRRRRKGPGLGRAQALACRGAGWRSARPQLAGRRLLEQALRETQSLEPEDWIARPQYADGRDEEGSAGALRSLAVHALAFHTAHRAHRRADNACWQCTHWLFTLLTTHTGVQTTLAGGAHTGCSHC